MFFSKIEENIADSRQVRTFLRAKLPFVLACPREGLRIEGGSPNRALEINGRPDRAPEMEDRADNPQDKNDSTDDHLLQAQQNIQIPK